MIPAQAVNAIGQYIKPTLPYMAASTSRFSSSAAPSSHQRPMTGWAWSALRRSATFRMRNRKTAIATPMPMPVSVRSSLRGV